MGGRSILGALIAALAAFSISVSNVSLPTFYESGGDVQAFLTGRNTMSFSAAALLVVFGGLLRGRQEWLGTGETGVALLTGTLYGAGGLLVMGSIVLIPVSLAILILFTFPVQTVLIEAVIDRRFPAPIQIMLVLVALAGVGIALDVQASGLNIVGVVMAASGAVLVAVTFVLNGRFLEHANPFAAAAIMALAGLAVIAGFALATRSFSLPPADSDGMIALAVAVAGSTVAFLAIFWAIKVIGATPTAMVMNLEPVLTIALSAWVLNDVPSLQRLIGATMVVGSVVLSQMIAAQDGAAERFAAAE
ncbi:MAG: DMT family transporter [Hyphomicrobiaceae bacterium]